MYIMDTVVFDGHVAGFLIEGAMLLLTLVDALPSQLTVASTEKTSITQEG